MRPLPCTLTDFVEPAKYCSSDVLANPVLCREGCGLCACFRYRVLENIAFTAQLMGAQLASCDDSTDIVCSCCIVAAAHGQVAQNLGASDVWRDEAALADILMVGAVLESARFEDKTVERTMTRFEHAQARLLTLCLRPDVDVFDFGCAVLAVFEAAGFEDKAVELFGLVNAAGEWVK